MGYSMIDRIAHLAHSVIERKIAHANSSSQVGQGCFAAIKHDANIASLIVALLLLTYPSDVSWFVVAVNVTTVECTTRWTRSNVSKKCGEVGSPLTAHRNTTAPIQAIRS